MNFAAALLLIQPHHVRPDSTGVMIAAHELFAKVKYDRLYLNYLAHPNQTKWLTPYLFGQNVRVINGDIGPRLELEPSYTHFSSL